ncbi:uncharacterized protein SCODWIG_02009 [Saccharomycodes ludwigii]|uniref:Uncharacterized protein n=1 Tax=Saccharomycodes ludwigii TaxID=36035 RepID=A0A376B6E0_9ASCO|nr:hypothetical protein SCDLUD_002782 [Saccharomycodes ludwigii]KAH3901291.1 hypothetical protein SCDLUD_002782 [Saccharomycodes ludwigii]SSD60248.1 uncharacterized protein SCODWIG_02009 [Saccharomycodes ludwigii]
MEFEFIEISNKDEDNKKHLNSTAQEEEINEKEFDFPLFSMGVTNSPSTHSQANNVSQGKDRSNLIKISLRDELDVFDEQIKDFNKRPSSYYLAGHRSALEKSQFEASCIDADYIIEHSKELYSTGFSISDKAKRDIDLNEFNSKIEKELVKEIKLKKRRPGKNQRMARKTGAKNELERELKIKEIKKMIKKKFHKRGGKKNKKKKTINPLADAGINQQQIPKFSSG